MKPTYHIDMDGVVAVFNPEASEEETHERGYFAAREAELSALAFVRLLLNAGEDVCILSSVYEDDHSADEKDAWLTANGLPDVRRIFVPYGKDKNDYIEAKDSLPVLIDDYTKNLIAWENSGYLAFKFMNGYNNQPKLNLVNGVVHVKPDSWTGYSIDKRMSPMQMYLSVTSISNAVANATERESA